MIRRVAGSRSVKQGHEIYGCPLCPSSDCKFFIWKEDVDVMLSDKNKSLEWKIASLELDKMLMKKREQEFEKEDEV
ncbi:hypothetical protein QVD17_37824 [Tagetes erecta]|uniref:Uncharacterized protein n=1 Tax=Tagetes erecta TaxID=13708 RepID=A0AAD8JVE8_TARER|nr:hypothetical protein QVD17_37824 [Tagetes erecta]